MLSSFLSNRITNSKTTLYRYNILLILVSLIVFIFFKPPYIINQTDEFDYITGSILLKQSPLGFGRFNMVFIFHLFYKNLHAISNILPLDAYYYFKNIVILFSVVSICMFFNLLNKFSKNMLMSFVAGLLLLTNYSLLRHSGALMTEMPMIFFLLLSLATLTRGVCKNNKKLIFTSAIFFGIGINVKEQIIFFLPWLFVALRTYRKNYYLLAIRYFIVVFVIAFIPPAYLYLKDSTNYLKSIKTYFINNMNNLTIILIKERFRFFLRSIIFLLVPSFVGLVYFLLRFKKKALVILLPIIITVMFSPMRLPRYYISLWLIITPLASLGSFIIIEKILNVINLDKYHTPTFILLALCYFLIFIGYFSQNLLNKDNEISLSYKKYSELLLTKFPSSEALFLVGDKTWLISRFLIPIARSKWKVVPSGWSWPGKELTLHKIINYSKRDVPVFIDPGQYKKWEWNDINAITKKLSLKPFVGTIYYVENISGY